jgi:hypothetical protein
MSCCDNNTETICPCDRFIHPRVIFNPPGRDAISYRVGDYPTFRHALLQARLDETELSRDNGMVRVQIWRPGGSGDLAVQMMEWWAYLADILTFYNERVANQAYLRTADLPESVSRLIRLLGYRPRPGIGATSVLAALANGPKAFTLPRGFQIQSKPGPGLQPQVFELAADTKVGTLVTGPPTAPQGEMDANPAPDSAFAKVGKDNSVLLQGTSSAVKAGEAVLLAPNGPGFPVSPFALAEVAAVTHEKDPRGQPITRIRFDPSNNVDAIGTVTDFRLLRSNQSSQLWQYPAKDTVVVNGNQVDLNVIARGIKAGSYILFTVPNDALKTELVTLAKSTEVIWYANPDNLADPSQGPDDPTKKISIPIPHTRLTLSASLTKIIPSDRLNVLVRYNWEEVGKLITPLAPTIGNAAASNDPSPSPITLQPSGGVPFPTVPADTPVLVEDAIGDGATGILDTASNLKLDDPAPLLVPPLRALFNLLPVTRGKSVENEVLGSGNAAIAGQDFVLQNTPVTYLQSQASVSGDDYSSTVRVWVNGLEWNEVRSFYGLSTDAQVFVTKEDEQGKTHVLFGDGEHGARLPTGISNVTATYRYGSGAQAPDPGSLTVVLQPQPGLKAIRNPVQAGGGSDPDAPAKIRKLAPRSVLTFSRAVSAADYETIAAQAPGVTRAKASFAFDAKEQRPRVKIWVGDNAGAVDAARSAVVAAADPNRLPGIELAMQIVIDLNLTLVLDPRWEAPAVLNAVHDALLDPDKGLLGANVVGIGQAFYDSQICSVCLRVPGVQAIHDISFSPEELTIENPALGEIPKFAGQKKISPPFQTKAAFRSGFQLQAASWIKRFTVNPPVGLSQSASPGCQCEHRHDPGDGGFFFLPDDSKHLTLNPAIAQ